MELLHKLFTAQPLLALFLTIALGYFVGKIKIGGFVLGGIAGTLLVGVVIGQLGINIDGGIKAVFFALAIAGQATMWMAVFADMGASLLVVANGLRLLRGLPGR